MSTKVEWTKEALERISKIPFFVRPLARRRIEAEAIARGHKKINAKLLEEIRAEQHGQTD